ncbi:succinate dehydrogenase, cytochrome b556 subunit [Pacificimonas flava]|uniref:Succinate dehydrogenase cytochrome b556 subunit n=2 Tax=Pacificimonas TaxID=1960290 RepID=A0A219B7L2_9SPHN|nr:MULTISPECIES: succinate dehydrogenase, cytochrome b556 subunit [Pacificimonas]MBZ6378629.1 succinate dehydrogenase, cytochrome b556 subunit [Pacificimonas aurantium]OWV34096.1 succinate dehydrogenase, cytochrome b556 subunit [Pacificimonas flava]
MATRPQVRPLSPHLGIWRWRVHAVTSITHRVTGNGLAVAGGLAFVWWLVAAALGPEAYADFIAVARSPIGVIVGVGLSWAIFQHAASGVRHLAMDTGAGLELGTSKTSATVTWVFSILATAALWLFILL